MSKLKIDFWDFSGLKSINPTGLSLSADNIMDMSILENEPQGRVMCVDEAEALYYKTHTCTYDDQERESALIERWCNETDITVTD